MLYPPISDYVIISPVRDEEKYVETTIGAVCDQTNLPVKWIIVDDGSRDRTPEILADYAARVSWIEVVRIERAAGRQPGSGVIRAFNRGMQCLGSLKFAYIVKLDCDLNLPPDYFERLLSKFEQDPHLGIAAGLLMEEHGDSGWMPIALPKYHAAGCSKIVRTECFADIGGFVTERGWDTVDQIRAQSKGWKTCHFEEPVIKHLKPEGTGIGFARTNIMHGEIYYKTGGGTVFFLLKVLHRLLFGRPFVVGGICMLAGFVRAWLYRQPQLVSSSEANLYQNILNKRISGRASELLRRLKA